MRKRQSESNRGSLKWIQRLVEYNPGILDAQLQRLGALPTEGCLTWLSPLRADEFAEYRDSDFLHLIGQGHLAAELGSFWPKRGPQWDALATDGGEQIFLLEVKAHAGEMKSTCRAEDDTSLKKIQIACDTTKQVLRADPQSDWLKGYYQYANRLAHLCFLRKHDVKAWLVFLYITGDTEMGGPRSEAEWAPHICAVHKHLGIQQNVRWVVSVFQSSSNL
jgi:hypothetical protein